MLLYTTTLSRLKLTCRSRLQSSIGDIVAVHISANTAIKPVYIQKGFLCATSQWFVDALRFAGENGEADILRFSDATPTTVQTFVYWLFHQRIPDEDEVTGILSTYAYQQLLCRAWVFADDRQIAKMQNAAMKALMEAFEVEPLKADLLNEALQKTQMQSKLRRMLVEEALLLETETRNGMLGKVKKEYLRGYLYDPMHAERAFEARARRRGVAEDYYV